MEIIKFMKLDLRKILQQYKLLVLLAIVAIVVTVAGDMGNWGLLYMGFAGVIMATGPLFADKATERGFYNLLPAHDGSRMRGRFLAGTVFVGITSLIGLVIAVVCNMIQGRPQQNVIEGFLYVWAAGVIFNSIQYVILSLMKSKNPQILGLVRIIPGFIMFFGGSYLQSLSDEADQNVLIALTEVIEYVINHLMLCAWMLMGSALVLTVILTEIAVRKER